MTYYKDLTDYAYFARHEPLRPMPRNIGWLSIDMPYDKGDTSQEFKDRLLEFCRDEFIVHIARGFHACEFCNLSDWYSTQSNAYGEQAHWASIGDGEIRVLGKTAVYAAPALVYHYVVEHGYKPPDEFVDAVLSGARPGSEEHLALLSKYQ
jgi:hypothetical protein